MAGPDSREVSFLAAARGRCPVCGQGKLYKGFLKIAPECSQCHTDFQTADTGDGPVVFVILIVGFIVCFGFMITALSHDWPLWLHMIIWLPLALVLSLGLMPPLKGLMVASQLKNRVNDKDRFK
ncbi:DUF983 domain-containing protein [Asticcacaulis sp. DW145]|jgi:uncharacterized protein (DUF983 family)|uniref:DUF983 domain-containing protein n=1 Tax=Asticcacaulis currens TaxID=2984210 RepID=A0ABT5IFC9_9CAUL|nr:DUF983 domain-containing protein [Asticcacaulis currens]MDC7694905.1 DUF983 domain-containing protein [Asticcacaulis currens]BEV12145.1 DUF983 domain-containing protein [Asticcacaulis sp. DW145]